MKKLIILVLLLLCVASANAQTRVMVVSDIHYLDSALRDDSDYFLSVLKAGDGKLTQEVDTLLEALKNEVERQRPDALLVTGDLSFNGEKASHEHLAQFFSTIEALGVPVWVLPGNHDINCPTPRRYSAEGWAYTEGVTPEAFAEIYADFLGPVAGGANLSYAVDVGEGLRVAMTDVSFYDGSAQVFGMFMAGHRDWLESVLQTAQADGVEIITASHHSLIAHTEFMKESYQMFGSESMTALDKEYGVRLHLSGHLHVQHIAREGELADAALGAFCTSPHRYAMVTLTDDGALSYEALALDDDLLPEGFQQNSQAWYLDISREKTLAALEAYDLSAADREAMANYAARFNLAYFLGTYRQDDAAWRDDPAYKLWKKLSDSLYWQYMEMVMNEPEGDNLRLLLK